MDSGLQIISNLTSLGCEGEFSTMSAIQLLNQILDYPISIILIFILLGLRVWVIFYKQDTEKFFIQILSVAINVKLLSS